MMSIAPGMPTRAFQPDTSNLHLPRILCLHGGGTNARIFRAQCRALSKMLENSFRLCYVEAPYLSKAGPDVMRVYQNYGPFKAWLRWQEDDSDRNANEVVDNIYDSIHAAMAEDDNLGATGEWTALMGFSQGAKICASLLYKQQALSEKFGQRTVWPRWRFAILLAGSSPLVWLDSEFDPPTGLVDAGTLSTALHSDIPPIPSAHHLRIPTLHVHGLQDPGIARHRDLLYRCCDLASARLIEWEGAHRVPIKSGDVTPIVEEIFAMARRTGARFNDPFSEKK